jgi:hypothetical protein
MPQRPPRLSVRGHQGEQQMRDAALPIALIAVGAVWLVWYQGWLPDKDWVIAIGLIAAGVAVLAVEGITRNSVVMGPFLMALGVAWIVHDRYRTSLGLIVPVMLIVLGALMLVARSKSIPERRAPPGAPH